MLLTGQLIFINNDNFDVIEGTDWQAPLYTLLQRRALSPLPNDPTIAVFNHGLTYQDS